MIFIIFRYLFGILFNIFGFIFDFISIFKILNFFPRTDVAVDMVEQMMWHHVATYAHATWCTCVCVSLAG